MAQPKNVVRVHEEEEIERRRNKDRYTCIGDICTYIYVCMCMYMYMHETETRHWRSRIIYDA